jgi:hypothetical protein
MEFSSELMSEQPSLFQFDSPNNGLSHSTSAGQPSDDELSLTAEQFSNSPQTAAASAHLPRTKAGSSLSSRIVFGVDLRSSIRSQGKLRLRLRNVNHYVSNLISLFS